MIYMTTDEWKEISKLIVAKDFDKLEQEICVETYDLDISKQELDEIIQDYKSKKGKRLWKARILDTPRNKDSICLFQKEYYTDVREMSVKEAIEWYKDLKEHLNDFESVYDSDVRGLYYKKDGEWVRYEEI